MYSLDLTTIAKENLRGIKDRRKQRQIKKQFERLQQAPHKVGKRLTGPLSGFYSARAAGQRYRIIYVIIDKSVRVVVVAVGIRKEGDKHDVYRRFTKLVKRGVVALSDFLSGE